MNKPRRKELQRALDLIQQARDIIEVVMNEEQEAHDNLPDSIQDSERGYDMEEIISDLESILDEIDTQYDNIDDIICR